MESSLQRVLAVARKRIVPTASERRFISRLAEQLRAEVEKVVSLEGMAAEVSVQGSVARDTWVRGEHDLDIFAKFDEAVERREWTDKFLPAVHRAFRRYRKVERYAEHPYLELWADHDTRVNIVPCYRVEKGRWKSATDRSPYHTEYMQKHLTRELRDEARLLKQFTKGIGVYGAEIRVGGFSGMLVETLVLRFRSFLNVLGEASSWKEQVFVDLEKMSSPVRFNSGFVIVDPVDPERNLAAAVRPDRLWSFVTASREFLSKPIVSFFFPPKPRARTKREFVKRLRSPHNDVVAVGFPHPPIVQDILWGQLFSLERAIVGVAERNDFRVVRSRAWSDENRFSAVVLEVERAVLPGVQVHQGPPVSRMNESVDFLAHHLGATDTVSGPWLSRGRWVVEKKRKAASFEALLRLALRDSRYGLTVPRQLERSFRNGMVVKLNEDASSLLKHSGFGPFLWEFLDGRPRWLSLRRS